MKNLKKNLERLQIRILLYQYFLIILVMKRVDTARNTMLKVRALEGQYFYPDLQVLTNEEHWSMTPATQKCAAAAESFCFSLTEDGEQQDVCNLINMPSVRRSLYLSEATNCTN